MIAVAAVRRYASALYAAADRLGVVDQVQADLALVGETVRENYGLRDAVTEPATPERARKRILERLFAPHVHELTVRFLCLLVDKRRAEIIPSLEKTFRRIADERRGIQRATIISAVPLTPDELAAAQRAIAGMTAKKVILETRVDPAVLGGMVVQVGDRLIDGSIRGQLQQIHTALAGTV